MNPKLIRTFKYPILRFLRTLIFEFFATWLVVTSCYAWNYDAHHVMAEMAYQNLSPAAKKAVLSYTRELYPYYHGRRFAQTASFADWIRFHDIEAFTDWHYIDIPYIQGDHKPVLVKSQQVVWAIHQAKQILTSKKSNRLEKALFLRFIIHFVGDVHQPMHCVSLYNEQFPEGDRGGNLYPIIVDGARINLHVIWDRGGRLFDNKLRHERGKYWQDIKKLAKELQIAYPIKNYTKAIADEDPQHWAMESHTIAVRHAYQTLLGKPVSLQYLDQATAIAGERLSLSAYRLAAVLNQVFSDVGNGKRIVPSKRRANAEVRPYKPSSSKM